LSAAVLGQMLPFSLGMQAEAGMARFLAEPVLAHRSRGPGAPFDFALERVAFSHDGERGAVSDIALAARQGGMTAIVGPSGAGKSSVIGLMMRFFDPQSGRVTVGGVDIAAIPPARLQALMALVNQDVHLFRDTLRANILLGAPGADEARLAAVIRAARLEELIRPCRTGSTP
jgi:ATP-binding cassette subfamily B protein